MPTFYARSTTVQLSTADLSRAITANPLTKQDPAATDSIRNIALEFAKSSSKRTLTEESLLAKDGSHVHFLGKHEDMPFFMAHAGKNFFDVQTPGKRNRRPARLPMIRFAEEESSSRDDINLDYTPSLVPHALCLTVFLSEKTFITKALKSRKAVSHDVKIDVYLNAKLCCSHYVPARLRTDNVRFTGQRIGRLIEKPWVFVPPSQNPDGSLRPFKRDKVSSKSTSQRWTAVSKTLVGEADKAGRDQYGERPVSGQYLESLAALPMPPELEIMQKAGKLSLAVLDVIIIWGEGSKDGPDRPYLTEPTPMRVEGFKVRDDDEPNSLAATKGDSTPSNHWITTSSASSIDTPCPTQRPRDSLSFTTSNSNPDIPFRPLTTTAQLSTGPPSPHTSGLQSHGSRFKRTREHSVEPTPQQQITKKPRFRYHDVITAKQTVEEEMKSIAAQAEEEQAFGFQASAYSLSRATRASLVNNPIISEPTTSSPPPSSVPYQPQLSTRTKKTPTVKHKSPPAKAPSQASPISEGMKRFDSRSQTSPSSSEFMGFRSSYTPPASSRLRGDKPHAVLDGANALDAAFTVPELSKDCSVTYAGPGVLRNVGASRSGHFKEEGVVMGVRFLVG